MLNFRVLQKHSDVAIPTFRWSSAALLSISRFNWAESVESRWFCCFRSALLGQNAGGAIHGHLKRSTMIHAHILARVEHVPKACAFNDDKWLA